MTDQPSSKFSTLDTLVASGATCLVAGIATVNWHAGLISAGVLLLIGAYGEIRKQGGK